MAWDDKILLPYAEHLCIVEKPDGARVVNCDCGHEFGDYTSNWKLSAHVYVRDTEETINEVYPALMGCHPDWMHLREYYCPECATQLEVEAVPPGYPVVFDFQPDLSGIMVGGAALFFLSRALHVALLWFAATHRCRAGGASTRCARTLRRSPKRCAGPRRTRAR